MLYFPGLENVETRSQVIAALEQRQVSDPASLITAHSLGLIYYWSALHAVGDQRVAWFQAMIPNWAMVLESDEYWKQWCAERGQVYGEPIAGAIIEKARASIKEKLQRCLVEASPDLENAFYLEGKAIRLLKQAKAGFRAEEIQSGPLMIKRLGLDAAVSEFFCSLLFVAQASPDQRQLMQCFSQLAYPAIYIERGQPQRALEALAQFKCDHCAGYLAHQNISENSLSPHTCAEDCPQFASFNPAYAQLPDRGKVLWQHAVELTAEAGLRLGEQRLLAAPPDALGAVQHWQNALAVASATGDSERLGDTIADILLSRAAALGQKDQLDNAILLLETTQAFDKAQRFIGKRAELLTDRGIQAGNAGQWEKSVADLRQALDLNPHLPRARQNFIVVLQNAAVSYREADDDVQARVFFEEAVRVLEDALRNDPQNAKMQEQLRETRAALAMLGGPADAAVDPFEELDKILKGLSGNSDDQPVPPKPVSEKETPSTPETQLRQAAEGKAKRRDYEGAIADLEKALRQSPQDAGLKQALAGIFEEYADDLLGKRDFEQAASAAERGLGYAPDHEGLKATLAAVRLFQPAPRTK